MINTTTLASKKISFNIFMVLDKQSSNIVIFSREGQIVTTTDEGFLCKTHDWDSAIAEQLAQIENIDLSDKHWQIINFIRKYYLDYKHLPNARVFTKAIRNALGESIGNSRYLHGLFPEGPLKYACKLAGLPKPPTCL